MGSRTLPTECRHGWTVDMGDFGDDELPNGGAEPCPECELERPAYSVRVHVEDGVWWATVDEMPGLHAAADSRAELFAVLPEVMELWEEPSDG